MAQPAIDDPDDPAHRDEYGYWKLDTNRCDLCGEPIEETDSPRVSPKANFGSEADGISPQEAIDAIVETITDSENEYEQRLADALRDNQGYCAHQHCLNQTTLYFAETGEVSDNE